CRDGEIIPLAGLEPLGDLLWLRPRDPPAAVRIVETPHVVLRLDLRLQARHAERPLLFAAEVKSAVPLEAPELQPDGEIPAHRVRHQMAELLFHLRVAARDDAFGDRPFPFADRMPA